MNYKKFLVSILFCIIVLTFGVSAQALTFSDLAETHWAYKDVSIMVADGRVNGFPDGEFKPNELVTRWQFVKMLGGSDPDSIIDPHVPATRAEAAEFIWIKADRPELLAPSILSKNSTNQAATSWAYTSGIMQGDDGLNLRLDSTLTRAEAAALIIRSEKQLVHRGFVETVDQQILKTVWDAMQTGIEYNKDATITYGQLSRLAVQIGSGERTPTYKGLLKGEEFEGEFAKDLRLVAQECLGESYQKAEYLNKPVTMQDAVSVLSYFAVRGTPGNISYGTKERYSDLVSGGAEEAEMGLYFARHNGIFLYADDTIHAKEMATLDKIAAILLQLDEILGLNKSSATVSPLKIQKTLYGYPKNAADYAYIVSGVPTSSYETPLVDGYLPVNSYDLMSDLKKNFAGFLEEISSKLPEGVKVKWTFIPSLAVESENDTVIRVKMEIISNPAGLAINDIFVNTLSEVYTGNSFYLDISLGGPIVSTTISSESYKVIRAFGA